MGRPVRIVGWVVGLLLLAAVLALRHPPPPARTPASDRAVGVAEMEATLAALREAVAEDPATVIVVGGSSLLEHQTLRPDETLRALLEGVPAPPMRVLAHPGFDALSHYLLADELSRVGARAVVLIANLQTFTDAWLRSLKIKHPELVAFLRPTRMPEAIALPLERAGLTDAAIVGKPILRWLGASALPVVLQAHRDRFRARLDGRDPDATATPVPRWPRRPRRQPPDAMVPGAGPPLAARPAIRLHHVGTQPAAPPPRRRIPPGRRRPRAPANLGTWVTSPFRHTGLYPATLAPDHPTVEILAAALRTIGARGTRTIVVLAPVHLQALRLTGAYQQRDIPGALDVLRRTAVAHGATVVDLSAALERETYFSDAYTHFTAEGNRRVLPLLVDALAGALDDGA